MATSSDIKEETKTMEQPVEVTSSAPSPTTTMTKEPSPDVPIFLRKTYHMIHSCDPEIVSWSDDGETFVVKDPVVFERTIIPQFFKHSKFTSFVRQLNFYSFRKIKNADTIRIDPELEAATANYWRFRHEYFRKDRPDLLTKIKRMNGPKSGSSSSTAPVQKVTTTVPTTTSPASSSTKTDMSVVSDAGATVTPDNAVSATPDTLILASNNNEVQTLKERIEEMSKNINELTAMVNQVSLKQEQHEKIIDPPLVAGTKRPKIELSDATEEETINDIAGLDSCGTDCGNAMIHPDEILSAIDMDVDVDEALSSLPVPPTEPVTSLPAPMIRESSNETDAEFVDQLFTAFQDENDDAFSMDDILPVQPQEQPTLSQTLQQQTKQSQEEANRPDPELMRRLSDALMLLPREIQEMIVDKLIAAITRTDFGIVVPTAEAKKVAQKGKVVQSDSPAAPQCVVERNTIDDMPLAAATLAALLQHYNSHSNHCSGGKVNKNVEKSIPVIPVHA